MSPETRVIVENFILNRSVMVCGVSDGKFPFVFTAWYVTADAKTLYFKSRTESTHMKILSKNPSIAVSIYDHLSTYVQKAGVQILGKVERVTSMAEMISVVSMYSKVFAGSGAKLMDIPDLLSSYVKSTMYKIEIEKLKMVNTSSGIEMLEYELWEPSFNV